MPARRKRSIVHDWFAAKYGRPTPAQRAAWPRIRRGENVLIASPTGTGKTFAAFLAVLDGLARLHAAGELRDTIHCLYISPLRALGYDLEKNLNEPLREIYGEKSPIRVELRSGDTTPHQRARQFTKPPHILLTTPESLCVLLSQEKWRPHLATVRWLIVDEIHALADNKRGVHLALSIERLAQSTPGLQPVQRARHETSPDGLKPWTTLQRIGLSATVAPLSEVARFLVGTHGQCAIVDVSARKRIELRIHTPLRKNPYPAAGYTGQRLVRELGALIRKHRTTLVFTNTRSGAEGTTFWLRESLPDLADRIECHHASLERDVRREVEDRLKRGELRAVVCSTSLELGIDIGSVELVVMMSTPKGVSKALQRAGRAGHNIHAVSRGVLMATNVSDLVESCATVLLARRRHLDDVRIPHAPLDVLAQHLVSMGCTRRWTRADALALVRHAYPFRHLEERDFSDVLDYLAGGGAALRQRYSEVFGKIELDDDGFQTRPGRVQRDFLQNIGTIPSVGQVRVRAGNRVLGSVEESFMRQIQIGDVFVLAGRPVRLEKVNQMEAWVTPAPGALPTVPRWNASKFPLSNRVCQEIIAFRSELRAEVVAQASLPVAVAQASSLQAAEPPRSAGRDACATPTGWKPALLHVARWIARRLDCGKANAEIIARIHAAQAELSEIPTADFLLVEEFAETDADDGARGAGAPPAAVSRTPSSAARATGRGRPADDRGRGARATPRSIHYFFHSLIGRAANDALARVVTARMSRRRGGNAIATPHDYGFVLTVEARQAFTEADLPALLRPEHFETQLDESLAQSEMLKYHFRNAAQTGLMVYRNFFDQQKPMRKLAWSAEVIFNVLRQHEPSHVLLREARRDTLHTFLDCDGALAFLDAQRTRPIRLRRVAQVPPLSFAMYATKIKEALLVEDPFEVQERLFNHWWSQIENVAPAL